MGVAVQAQDVVGAGRSEGQLSPVAAGSLGCTSLILVSLS